MWSDVYKMLRRLRSEHVRDFGPMLLGTGQTCIYKIHISDWNDFNEMATIKLEPLTNYE